MVTTSAIERKRDEYADDQAMYEGWRSKWAVVCHIGGLACQAMLNASETDATSVETALDRIPVTPGDNFSQRERA